MLEIREKMPHLQKAWDQMHYSAKKCRAKAETLLTQAEIYEEAAMELERAIEKEGFLTKENHDET